VDTREPRPVRCCDACALPLSMLANGQCYFASVDGRALHVECALTKRSSLAATLTPHDAGADEEYEPAAVSRPVSQEDGS
jgi:hypothetical protein